MTTLDRKVLVSHSLKRLKEQKASIERDIERDCAFIEEKTEKLPELTITKKVVEQQIAERMTRVDNLRITLQMIELTLELLVAEQKRLQ